MNKTKHLGFNKVPSNFRKRIKKELRVIASGAKKFLSPLFGGNSISGLNVNKPSRLLSTAPSNKKSYSTASFRVRRKKTALKSLRHRSDSISSGREGNPQVIHVEGRRWIKTLEKQSALNRKRMVHYMNKKGGS